MQGWKQERKIKDLTDDLRVLSVRANDCSNHLKKVDDVLAMMAREIGCPATWKGCRDAFGCSPGGSEAYLCVSTRKKIVVGCCVVQGLKSAPRLIVKDVEANARTPTSDSHASKVSDRNEVELDESCIEVTLKSFKAHLGINYLWTASAFRHKGIATGMLDAIRRQFCYGYPIPKDETAFSQPTAVGKAFASAYFGRKDFLTFG